MKKILLGILFVVSVCSFAEIVQFRSRTKSKDDLELVFILDRSGSMSGLETDTIGGYNSMLKKQKNSTKGEVYVTTVLFDDKYELLYNDIPISRVKTLTDKEYYVRGGTALLDAVGKTISELKNSRNMLAKNKRAGKVLFIIITDGLENSSKEYTYTKIKQLIEAQKKEKWEFLFLGANIDAIGVAEELGISPERAVKYKSDSIGTQKNYKVLDKVIQEYRLNDEINDSWKKEIEEDVKNREE